MRHAKIRERLRRDPESGQATTEFALILIPLLIVVAGIIYFGIGLNYWLDMNRVANQGARAASVDNWPAACPRDTASPPTPGYSCAQPYSACDATTGALKPGSKASLQAVLFCSLRTNNPANNCQPGKVCVTLCYPGETAASATVGDPVQVKITQPYKFFFVNTFQITLTAKATMRLEQVPKVQSGGGGPSCT